jgi:dienelactone hydrolase
VSSCAYTKLALLFCFAAILPAQKLDVSPPLLLSDQPAVIQATGLQPGEHITIRAALTDGAGQAWASEAEFIADSQGTVDLSKVAPIKGFYNEISPLGLIWSMLPQPKSKVHYQHQAKLAAQVTKLELIRQDKVIAQAELEQLAIADGVMRVPIHQGDLRGILFIPRGAGSHPGALVLGGSEGGLPAGKAAWLASHGFLAFALAYFKFDDLPSTLEAIPLEYFERALLWLDQRPELLDKRVAVVGTSRGGELALQLGSMFSQISAVVAYVPADVRVAACCGPLISTQPAWTWKGSALPYVRHLAQRVRQDGFTAQIAVEHTQGPILLISGDADLVWASAEMSDSVVRRLKNANFAYPVENLKYHHAGHDAGQPAIAPKLDGKGDHGGSTAGNAESTIDANPKVLEFLRKALVK